MNVFENRLYSVVNPIKITSASCSSHLALDNSSSCHGSRSTSSLGPSVSASWTAFDTFDNWPFSVLRLSFTFSLNQAIAFGFSFDSIVFRLASSVGQVPKLLTSSSMDSLVAGKQSHTQSTHTHRLTLQYFGNNKNRQFYHQLRGISQVDFSSTGFLFRISLNTKKTGGTLFRTFARAS